MHPAIIEWTREAVQLPTLSDMNNKEMRRRVLKGSEGRVEACFRYICWRVDHLRHRNLLFHTILWMSQLRLLLWWICVLRSPSQYPSCSQKSCPTLSISLPSPPMLMNPSSRRSIVATLLLNDCNQRLPCAYSCKPFSWAIWNRIQHRTLKAAHVTPFCLSF